MKKQNPKDIKEFDNISVPIEVVIAAVKDYQNMTAKEAGKKHGISKSSVIKWGRLLNGPKRRHAFLKADPPLDVILAAWKEAEERVYKLAEILGIGRSRAAAVLERAGIPYRINGQAVVVYMLDDDTVRCSICASPVVLEPEDQHDPFDKATEDGVDHQTCRDMYGKGFVRRERGCRLAPFPAIEEEL